MRGRAALRTAAQPQPIAAARSSEPRPDRAVRPPKPREARPPRGTFGPVSTPGGAAGLTPLLPGLLRRQHGLRASADRRGWGPWVPPGRDLTEPSAPPQRGGSGPGGGSAASDPDVGPSRGGEGAGRAAAVAGSGRHAAGGPRTREDSAAPCGAVGAAGGSAAAAQRDPPAPREAPPHCACATPRAAAPPSPRTASNCACVRLPSRQAGRGRVRPYVVTPPRGGQSPRSFPVRADVTRRWYINGRCRSRPRDSVRSRRRESILRLSRSRRRHHPPRRRLRRRPPPPPRRGKGSVSYVRYPEPPTLR